MEECETCHGSGAKAGTQAKTCTTCNGQGQVRVSQGFFSIQQTCPQCHGSGKVIAEPCVTCGGAGRVRKSKTLSVKIPAGVDHDDRIRLSGEGEAGLNGGPHGDLYVVVNLKEHPVFQRENNDLHCEMPIGFATAAMGGEIEIPTLDGHAKIKIPAETQTGQVFRLRGKGIKGVRSSGYGDLFCHVAIETPVKLTARQKELLREFEAINAQDRVRTILAPRTGSTRSASSSSRRARSRTYPAHTHPMSSPRTRGSIFRPSKEPMDSRFRGNDGCGARSTRKNSASSAESRMLRRAPRHTRLPLLRALPIRAPMIARYPDANDASALT